MPSGVGGGELERGKSQRKPGIVIRIREKGGREASLSTHLLPYTVGCSYPPPPGSLQIVCPSDH